MLGNAKLYVHCYLKSSTPSQHIYFKTSHSAQSRLSQISTTHKLQSNLSTNINAGNFRMKHGFMQACSAQNKKPYSFASVFSGGHFSGFRNTLQIHPIYRRRIISKGVYTLYLMQLSSLEKYADLAPFTVMQLCTGLSNKIPWQP